MILAGVFLLCALIAGYFLGEPRRLTVLSIATAAVEPMPIALVGSLSEPNKPGKKTSRVLSPGIWITNDSFSVGRSQVLKTCVLRLLARSTKEYCRSH
jgi:hypothetical protein